jgi:hypothetical protein
LLLRAPTPRHCYRPLKTLGFELPEFGLDTGRAVEELHESLPFAFSRARLGPSARVAVLPRSPRQAAYVSGRRRSCVTRTGA